MNGKPKAIAINAEIDSARGALVLSIADDGGGLPAAASGGGGGGTTPTANDATR